MGRNDQSEWMVANYAACRGQALADIGRKGDLFGIPKDAVARVKSMIVQEEAVDKIRGAAIETGTKIAESILGRLPNFFNRG